MNLTIILAVLGVIITVVFGSLSVYLIKKKRYPGMIIFFRESSIGLFDSIVKNLSELYVLYENNPVSENLVLLKGIFYNDGTKDIEESKVEEKLAINLDKDYKWLTGKVIPIDKKIKTDIKIIDDTKLEFNLGLFRCNEYIRFEALAEIPTIKDDKKKIKIDVTDKLLDTMSFSHRIADTNKIEERDLFPENNVLKLKTKHMLYVMVGYLLFILLFTGIFSMFFSSKHGTIQYSLINNNESIDVNLTPMLNDSLTVKAIDGSWSKKIHINKFLGQISQVQIIPKERLFPSEPTIIFGFIAAIIFLILLLIYRKRKHNKYIKIFNVIQET